MNTQQLLTLGRWMFALTFVMGGLLHITGPEFTATQVPKMFGAPYFWVYFTGFAQIGTIHIPRAISGDFMGVIGAMRDFGYAGAAILYAAAISRDRFLEKKNA